MIGFSIKLFADNIEEVRPGPRDGVFATGSTRLQEAAVGVTPQVLPSMVGNMLYLLDISLRSSTVLGIVGAGGIGFLLNNAAKTLKFEVMGGIVLCIFGIVYAIELLANWIRKQII
jgi:phosphonate transport system permease protein